MGCSSEGRRLLCSLVVCFEALDSRTLANIPRFEDECRGLRNVAAARLECVHKMQALDANDEQVDERSAAEHLALSSPIPISAMDFCTIPRLIRETLQLTAAMAACAAASRNPVSTFE